MLDRIDILELKILIVLSKPEKANKELGSIIKDPNEPVPGYIKLSTSWGPYSAVETLAQLLKVNKAEIDEALYVLELERLVVEDSRFYKVETNGHPIHVLDNMLTSKGKEFLNYIQER